MEHSLLWTAAMPNVNRADDQGFDTVYPVGIRLISRRVWTPVAVARRAAELFHRAGARHILDVGSGVGKFVLAAAAASPKVDFLGVEQRARLVDVARRARTRLGISNARFQVGDVTKMDWSAFDGVYLFNPLAENLFPEEDTIDDRVELTKARFLRDATRVESALRRARIGTSIVTYHGASTRIPASYELEALEAAGADLLRQWTKRRETDDGSYFIEADGGVVRHRAPAVNCFASSKSRVVN